MTMLSFRVEDEEATELETWAANLGVARSELLREALRKHLASLRGRSDAEKWEQTPLEPEERSLAEISDWGPAEDWADWDDAAR